LRLQILGGINSVLENIINRRDAETQIIDYQILRDPLPLQ